MIKDMEDRCEFENCFISLNTQLSTINYSYDLNGSLISKTIDGSDTTLYEWDWRNMLVQVTSNQFTVTSYEYDGDGNRISKTVDGVKTKYINDIGLPLVQVLMETNSAGTVQSTYTYGNNLISMNRAGVTSYYHYNKIGSAQQLTDDTETVIAEYTYDAFGNVLSQTTGEMAYNVPAEEEPPVNKAMVALFLSLMLGMGIVTIKNRKGGLIILLSTALITLSIPTSTATEADATGNPYGFTGESQFGEGDDLVFLRARYYSPSTGRFISREPILSPMIIQHQMFILIENAICSSSNCNSSKVTILREPVWLVPFLIYNPQILNPYVYCYNNPVNWVDNNGLLPAWVGIGASVVGGIVALAGGVFIAAGAIGVGVTVLVVGTALSIWGAVDSGLLDSLKPGFKKRADDIDKECP